MRRWRPVARASSHDHPGHPFTGTSGLDLGPATEFLAPHLTGASTLLRVLVVASRAWRLVITVLAS